MKTTLLAAALVSVGLMQYASAGVLVDESFSYSSLAELQVNWGTKTGLSLDVDNGNPAPAGAHDGSAQAHTWIGSTLSLTPTDTDTIYLTADIWSSDQGNQRNTVGFRTGANPLFEMGMYNAIDNDVNGPLGASASGIGVRLLGMGSTAYTGQRWIKLGEYYTGWSRWEATFTPLTVTVRVDQGIDGTWDIDFTTTSPAAVGIFSDLRFGGPSALASEGGPFKVDNISLAIVPVPEPSVTLLTLVGGMALLLFRRRV